MTIVKYIVTFYAGVMAGIILLAFFVGSRSDSQAQPTIKED